MLVGACGFGLALATILVLFYSGLSIGILAGLLAVALLFAFIDGKCSVGQLVQIPLSLRILDDGSVELGSSQGLDKDNADGMAHLARMEAQVSRYQLAPGSLIWPSLIILRLQAVSLSLDTEPKSTPTISIVIFKRILSEQNRRALARWLIWAQHKTRGQITDPTRQQSLTH